MRSNIPTLCLLGALAMTLGCIVILALRGNATDSLVNLAIGLGGALGGFSMHRSAPR